jgi:hypothetical protein
LQKILNSRAIRAHCFVYDPATMDRMAWTDERMDDFAAHTYRRFDGVDRRFDSIERRMEDGFKKVNDDIGGLRAEMNARFDGLQRTLLQLGGGVIVALIGLIATQL